MTNSYKCPGCGAALEFDAETQKMRCSHCDITCTVEEIEELTKQMEQREDTIEGEFSNSAGVGSYKMFRCPSCGAELLTDENTAATFCSFCGTPTLVEERLDGELTPEVIIPFKIEKESAKETYRNWAKKGIFTPGDFYSSSTIEKITGMYVPFWLYDYNAGINMTAECTKVRTERHGDYEHIITSHYMVIRDVDTEYNRIPADAAEKMPDEVMDKLEPFKYEELTDFGMPYLSGYYAEKYTYKAEDMLPRIEKRVKKYIYDAARATMNGYNTVRIINQNTRLRREKAVYAFMPVWILNYRYKGKDYMFTLNGQTGRIVAERPVSKAKMAGCFGIVTTIAFAVLMGIGMLI